MSNRLVRILEEIDQLVPDERRLLIERLLAPSAGSSPLSDDCDWMPLRGAMTYDPTGEDAQAWVTRTRRESDERGKP